MRQTVSKEFRNLVLKELPGCRNKQSYMKFLQYILFSNQWDKEDSSLLKIPRTILATCEDKLGQILNENYHGERFLREFDREVLTLHWKLNITKSREWSYTRGKCRVVKFKLPSTIEQALQNEDYKDYDRGGRVYFLDGKKFTRRNRKANLESVANHKAIEDLNRLNTKGVHFKALEVFRYMSSVKLNHFTKLVDKNIESVRQDIESNSSLDSSKKKWLLNLLDIIEENPLPLYKGSANGNTCRLHNANACILALPRQYRKMLCKGWTEFDIKSSQLAIVSGMWGIPSIQEFLIETMHGGPSVWELLADEFNTANKHVTKKFFKETLYSVIFGRLESKLKNVVEEELGEGYGQRFLDFWLIKDLLDARRKQMQLILNAAESNNGYFYILNTSGSRKKYFINNKKKIDDLKDEGLLCDPLDENRISDFEYCQHRRIMRAMAYQVQLIEMLNLNPIIDLAKSHANDFVITLWQHDGFSVKFMNQSKRDKFTKLICNTFDNFIQSITTDTGIIMPTFLEYQHLM